ncbi:hypothetical protein [Mammaliicoccus sciuri]|uniref:hypothetical protein n=1 Tax=Mammaliicoccus sciuri TaxID=1296 RepID=UPI001CA87943|nr:hypothetical protein [Mammaliicoccus sciuri]
MELIIININIYTQNEKFSIITFLYEHGVESLAAIVTLFAFIVTFRSILNNNKKDKENEIKRNHKTLQMIDLITEHYRKKFEIIINKIDDFDNNIGNAELLNDVPMYEIKFDSGHYPNGIIDRYETPMFKSYITFSKYNYLKSKLVISCIENYDFEIKKLVSNHYLNLNNDSLDKITNKLITLKNLKFDINDFNLNSLYSYESPYKYEIYKGNKKYTVEYDQELSKALSQIEAICKLIKDVKKPIS